MTVVQSQNGSRIWMQLLKWVNWVAVRSAKYATNLRPDRLRPDSFTTSWPQLLSTQPWLVVVVSCVRLQSGHISMCWSLNDDESMQVELQIWHIPNRLRQLVTDLEPRKKDCTTEDAGPKSLDMKAEDFFLSWGHYFTKSMFFTYLYIHQ